MPARAIPALEGERARGAAAGAEARHCRRWPAPGRCCSRASARRRPRRRRSQAAEMVLVRLAYVADLPSPAELIRALDGARRRRAGHRAGAAARRRRRRAASAVGRGGASAAAALRRAASASPVRAPRPACAAAAKLPRGGRAVRRSIARRCCARISTRMCISCASSRGGSSCGPTEARAARPRQPARPACCRNGPASAGWSASRASRASRRCASRPRRAAQSLKSEAARDPLVRAVLEAFPGARDRERCARPRRRREPSRCPMPTTPTTR